MTMLLILCFVKLIDMNKKAVNKLFTTLVVVLLLSVYYINGSKYYT